MVYHGPHPTEGISSSVPGLDPVVTGVTGVTGVTVITGGDVTAKWQSDCKPKILYCFSHLDPTDCPGNKFSSFRHLAPLGATWRHLAPLGATWRHLAPLGTFADLCETPSPKFSEGIKPLKQYRKKAQVTGESRESREVTGVTGGGVTAKWQSDC